MIEKNTINSHKRRVYGYIFGILSGVAYGTNPLFGLPLLNDYQMPVDSVLFYRYGSATVCMFVWMLLTKKGQRVSFSQGWVLLLLGVFFSMSSLLLFTSYHYIPSGIATTIIYLEPVLIALIMVFLKRYPSWQKWLAILISFIGVIFLCQPDTSAEYHWQGFVLAFLSALSYAFYLVIVNCSRRIKKISGTLLGFITLLIGTIMFFVHSLPAGIMPVPDLKSFGLILGLGLVPTIGSLITMTYATRTVGATTTAILGVMEPFTAMCIGVAIFGEPMTAFILIGFVITVGAIIFMTLTDRNNKEVDEVPVEYCSARALPRTSSKG